MSEIQRASRAQRKETEALEGLVAAVGIRNGIQCKNWLVDQQKIMSLLTRIPISNGGTGPTRFGVARDGYCDPALSAQIRRFQQTNGLPADGVVDAGGATLRALQKLAAGGHLAGPNGSERLAQEYINYLYELVNVGKKALHHPGLPSRVRSPLGIHLTALEANLKTAGLKPTVVRGFTLVETYVFLALVALAIGTFALMSNPEYRKAFINYVRGLGKAAVGVVEFLLENEVMVIRLVTDYWLFVMTNAASAIFTIAHEVEKLADQQRCRDQFNRYTKAKDSVLEKIRLAKLPGARIDPDGLASSFIEFMASVYALMDCSGALNKLRAILALVSGPGGVIKFVVSTLLGRKFVFPFPIPPWVP